MCSHNLKDYILSKNIKYFLMIFSIFTALKISIFAWMDIFYLGQNLDQVLNWAFAGAF